MFFPGPPRVRHRSSKGPGALVKGLNPIPSVAGVTGSPGGRRLWGRHNGGLRCRGPHPTLALLGV